MSHTDLHYVCFTPNLAYLPYLERCVKGLLSRVGRPDRIQLVFLMHQEVTKKHGEPLLEIVESFGAPAPIVKYPELELNLDFRTEDGNNVLTTRSQAPFYRLFMPTLLLEADQCLYLDIDIAILDDLTPLMETDLGECYIGGVTDRLCLDPAYDKHTTAVGIKPAHYINGGVMLMNLKALRRDRLLEVIEVMGRIKAFPYMDQDIINYVCMGNVKLIEKKYNVYPGDCEEELEIIRKKAPECAYLFDSDAVIHPSIVHYVGPRKPWENSEVEYADLYNLM